MAEEPEKVSFKASTGRLIFSVVGIIGLYLLKDPLTQYLATRGLVAKVGLWFIFYFITFIVALSTIASIILLITLIIQWYRIRMVANHEREKAKW